MKKKILAIISLILVLITLSACGGENYWFGELPLPGGPAISDPIIGGNSGVVVQKGSYVYMINGAVIDGENGVPTDNEFGVPEKGAIYRLKLDDNGNIIEDEARLMAPKIFYSRTAGDGIYIPDNSDKLYYISPSTAKGKNGNTLFTYSDIFSVNLDGTGTKKLGTVEYFYSSKFVTIDEKTYFVYDVQDFNDDGDLMRKMMAMSEDGKIFQVESGYTLKNNVADVLIGDDGYIYYTRPVSKYGNDDEITGDEKFNKVFKKAITDNPEDKEVELKLLNGNIISEFKYNIDLIEFKLDDADKKDVKKGTLYYTKNISADSTAKTLYFAYKDGKEYQLNYLETLTNPYFLGFDGSDLRTLFYDGSSLVLAKAGSSEAPVKITTLGSDFKYLYMEDDTLYLMDSGKMYSIEIGIEDEKYIKTELTKDFKITMDLERYFPKKIGNIIYFIGTSDKEYYNKYLYRHDVTKEWTESDEIPVGALGEKGTLSKADKELRKEAEEE